MIWQTRGGNTALQTHSKLGVHINIGKTKHPQLLGIQGTSIPPSEIQGESPQTPDATAGEHYSFTPPVKRGSEL